MNILHVDSPTEAAWVTVGLFGQLLFTGRFLVQWISSERAKRSIIPMAFWYFSISGGLILLAYAIYRKDPVFVLGQSMGVFIYTRNILLIRGEAKRAREESSAQAPPAARSNAG
nr:lipid-A-disaccharide synthase N-terminal domain-containing protein [Thetidibacter halocola]